MSDPVVGLDATSKKFAELPSGNEQDNSYFSLERITSAASAVFVNIVIFLSWILSCLPESVQARATPATTAEPSQVDRKDVEVNPAPFIPSVSKKDRNCLSFETAHCSIRPFGDSSDISSLLKTFESVSESEQFNIETDEEFRFIRVKHSDRDIYWAAMQDRTLQPYVVSSTFRNCFQTAHCSKASTVCSQDFELKDKKTRLLQEAEQYATKKKSERLQYSLQEKRENTSQNSLSPEEILTSIYADHKGLCVGERHNERAPKKFIMDNMKVLRDSGVTTLFLEHLFYDTMQPFLDEYFEAEGDAMPRILKASLFRLDTFFGNEDPGGYSYTELVKAAKQAGIRVVGIDTSVSYECGFSSYFGSQGFERHAGMNYVAAKIIEHEKGERKYIALMGSAHGVTIPPKKEGEKSFPGVTELLEEQCPFIIVEEGQENESHFNVTNYLGMGIYAHAVISVVS